MSSNKTNNAPLNVQAIKAFNDNYIWAITNAKQVALVDPGDAQVCIDFIEQQQLYLNAILITHHHPDHTGGIEKLRVYCQQKKWSLTVYGPANENIPHCDVKLSENDQINVLDAGFKVIDLPGHTAGHIAYFDNNDTEASLFCGDTLFSGGCGRLFEGSAEQMLHSLSKLAKLPEHTKVYCAHEYTQANLKFALTIEPNNKALKDYYIKVNDLRSKGQASIPTTIQLEKQINPFLRCHQLTVQTSAMQLNKSMQTTELETFTTIRRWKDKF